MLWYSVKFFFGALLVVTMTTFLIVLIFTGIFISGAFIEHLKMIVMAFDEALLQLQIPARFVEPWLGGFFVVVGAAVVLFGFLSLCNFSIKQYTRFMQWFDPKPLNLDEE